MTETHHQDDAERRPAPHGLAFAGPPIQPRRFPAIEGQADAADRGRLGTVRRVRLVSG